ncbi:hypothetical protein BH23ACT11_BH23ACT11_21450 [soil metagenome]
MPSTPTVRVVSGALDDALRRELVYEGEILIFKNVAPMVRLCEFTDDLIKEALDTSDPVHAQFKLEPEEHAEKIERSRNGTRMTRWRRLYSGRRWRASALT